MSEPTEADRKRAVALLRAASADGLIEATEPGKQPEMVERIAAALADGRAKGAAEELLAVAREALDKTSGWEPVMVPVADLYSRADELDPT